MKHLTIKLQCSHLNELGAFLESLKRENFVHVKKKESKLAPPKEIINYHQDPSKIFVLPYSMVDESVEIHSQYNI